MFLAVQDIVYNLSYILVWLFLASIYFHLLRTIKLERLFPQGKIGEIKVAYFLLIVTLSYISTEAFYKIFSIFKFN